MFDPLLIIAFFLMVSTGLGAFILIRYDPLLRFEPITDEEMLLLTLVDEEFYPHLLEYVRTLNMSVELQDHLKDRKDSLESISYFMLTQAARREQEKKERWEKERMTPRAIAALSHNERMILQRIKRWL